MTIEQNDRPTTTFLEELKRRKTVRVALVYLAAAYAVLQVADIVLPALGAPEWMDRGLVLVSAIGLPVAIILAWAFRITPDGVRREVDADSPDISVSALQGGMSWFSARAVIAIVTLVVGSVLAGWMIGESRAGAGVASIGGGSIAVLPFDDFSAETGQEWFASGMQEALITALQKIGALRVTSRTSTMQYAGTTMSLPEIAVELGTRWLVEGSVTRVADQIRITAQLIDGETDEHIWADDYEDRVENILELQGDVARAIAGEIDIALSPEDRARLDDAPDVAPEVYRAFILGLDRFFRITPENFRAALDLFEEAIAIDSTFAPAHAALAVSYATAVEYGWISVEEGAEPARRAAAIAVRLAPGSSQSHHAVGSVAYHIEVDFEAAEAAFREAADRGPTAYVLQDYAWMLANLGRHAEAIPIVSRAIEIDPRSPLMQTDLAWWTLGSGDAAGAIREAQRAVELDPRYGEAHWALATAYAELGEVDAVMENMARYEEIYGESLPYFRGFLLAEIGRRDEALALVPVVQAAIDRGESYWSELALLYIALGERELALDAAERIDRPRISFMPLHLRVWRTLFDEPRFLAVLERLGFPAPQ